MAFYKGENLIASTAPANVITSNKPLQQFVELTKAAYDALPSKDPDVYYFITDDIITTGYDDRLDSTSINAVQNRVITETLATNTTTVVYEDETVVTKDSNRLTADEVSLKYSRVGNVVTVFAVLKFRAGLEYPIWCNLTEANVMPIPNMDEAYGHFIFDSDTSNSSCKVTKDGKFCVTRTPRNDNGTVQPASTLTLQKEFVSFTYICK